MIAVLLGISALMAQQNSISKAGLRKEWDKLARIKKQMQKVLPGFSFSATLVYKGKPIAEQVMGYAAKNQRLVMDNKAIYRWEGISKIFTSLAVLQLAERSELNINDPITQYIPGLGKSTEKAKEFSKIKIYHLVNAASNIDWVNLQGYLDKRYPEGKVGNLKEVVKPFLRYATIDSQVSLSENSHLETDPNSQYLKINGDYTLLEIIIEQVSEEPFAQYISNNIFKPLGMLTAHYGKTPAHLKKYLSDSPSDMKINHQVISLKGRADASKSLRASGTDMLKLLNFLTFRQRKKNNNRYEKILRWQTIKKYYHDVDTNKPKSYHAICSKKQKRIMVSAFGLVYMSDELNNSNTIMLMSDTLTSQLIMAFSPNTSVGLLLMTTAGQIKNNKEYLNAMSFVATFGDFMMNNKIRNVNLLD